LPGGTESFVFGDLMGRETPAAARVPKRQQRCQSPLGHGGVFDRYLGKGNIATRDRTPFSPLNRNYTGISLFPKAKQPSNYQVTGIRLGGMVLSWP
jgi:hypothetical protein